MFWTILLLIALCPLVGLEVFFRVIDYDFPNAIRYVHYGGDWREHHIFTENEKEGSKILRRLGFNQKIIKSFIKSINNCYEDDEEQIMKEIMMGKVPKRLLN